jgi:hypothetical protein
MNAENRSSQLSPQDERIMAGLSHVSIFIPLMGFVAPILIWITQKDKSDFVAFQALQALAYQLALIIFWILGMGCYMASFFITFAATMGLTFTIPVFEEAGFFFALFSMLVTFVPFIIFGLVAFVGLAFVIYAIVGAVMVFQGRDFRYAILGSWLERYLEQASNG